ncbi:MAG: Gfo/Idh/MocA family oxidoreductase, partial [Mediterranea sp.]|nr:Gfo/Idh/MocA family oxidoreductase [Mediterranea sp.]
IDKHSGFNLYAVTERNTKKAQKDYPHLISYDSVDELLNDAAIELVIINTPNCFHYEHAKATLLKGKHILVEKPFTANRRQAEELFKLADGQGKEVLFYQNRRWDSDYLSVKEVIESGKLGKLNEMHIRYDRYRTAIGVKTFKESPVEASGLQFDLGPHLLDHVISLFGKPVSYRKVLSRNRKDTQVDDYFFTQMTYPNLNVTVTANLLVPNPQPAFILHGSEGTYTKHRTDIQEEQLSKGLKPGDAGYGIEPPEKQGILTLIDKDGVRTEHCIPSQPSNYWGLFDAVYQTIVFHKPYPIKREDILAQLEILES